VSRTSGAPLLKFNVPGGRSGGRYAAGGSGRVNARLAGTRARRPSRHENDRPGGLLMVCVTNVPRPGAVSIHPSAVSSANAARTVFR
jgi:hypothetical protein